MFRVGQKVVLQPHGVGRIEAIEQLEVSGSRQFFYILRILGTEMTIMVPTGNAERVGLRQLIAHKEVSKVMEILGATDVEVYPEWDRHFKDNRERIKTGSLYEVATVLRKLVLLQKERNLSFVEKKELERVRRLLVEEISHAVGIDEKDALTMVDRTIAKSEPKTARVKSPPKVNQTTSDSPESLASVLAAGKEIQKTIGDALTRQEAALTLIEEVLSSWTTSRNS